MKVAFFLFTLLLCQITGILAQPIYSTVKQGNIWMLPDSLGLDFNYSPPKPFHASTPFYDLSLAAICDTFGRLRYYDKVDNMTNQVVMNRDSQWIPCTVNPYGNDWSITWFLPFTGTRVTGYITNEGDYRNHHYGMGRMIYNRILDSLNQGKGGWHGSMNHIVSDFDSMRSWSGASVRHANGRDWWVASHRHGDDTIFVMLATPDTMLMVHRLSVGTDNCFFSLSPTAGANVGMMVFSQDGSRLLNVNGEGLVEVYDFDRCSGILINPLQIEAPNVVNGIYRRGMYTAAFAPSGRYIYTCQVDELTEIIELVQYDLNASNPGQSRTVLYSTNNNNWGFLIYVHLGPDGKIYLPHICNSNNVCFPLDSTKLSVILYPDSGGLACQFTPNYLDMRRQVLPTFLSMAPNYNLGPIDGSPCDTLGIDTRPADPDTTVNISSILWPKELRIYPNPVQETLTLESDGMLNLQACLLYDMQGRVVLSERSIQSRTQWHWQVHSIPAGQYILEVQTDQGVFRSPVSILVK